VLGLQGRIDDSEALLAAPERHVGDAEQAT
jgi:hypothetical protein